MRICILCAVYLKNISGIQKTFRGVVLADSAYYLIPETSRYDWHNDSTIFDNVSNDEAQIAKSDDGINDIIDKTEQWNYLGNLIPPTIKLNKSSSVTGTSEVIVKKPEGSSGSIASHNWTDPCTWYTESIRVTGETLILNTGKIYDIANSNIIDLIHGRVSDEDDISSSYLVKVYDNGVEKTEDTDYTVDYENGKITFVDIYTVTGPVTADYSYENGSEFRLVPESGKRLDLEHAELQFSKDIDMNSSYIDFDIWVYNPLDLPNKILYKRKRYKNIKDILNSANLGQGEVPVIAGLLNPVLVFPFNYVTTQSLLSSQGAELRISINDDKPLLGEWATTTFYITSEAE